MSNYIIKRIYDDVSEKDGYRVLVDRLWPRGVSKERAQLDEWNKDIAPSTGLREWFGHKPERFEEFSVRYRAELYGSEALKTFKSKVEAYKTVTLLYGAHDPKINHVVVLCDILSK
jgi:uncharacterized protein YeaO (DUF488 family)